MEFVINKIMSIDKDAENYRRNTHELLKEREIDLQNTLDIMEKQWQEEAKNLKENILKEKLKEAEEKAKRIRRDKEEQLSNINKKYYSNKDEIVDEIFHMITNSL